jgi:hypothetical protein
MECVKRIPLTLEVGLSILVLLDLFQYVLDVPADPNLDVIRPDRPVTSRIFRFKGLREGMQAARK